MMIKKLEGVLWEHIAEYVVVALENHVILQIDNLIL